MAWTWTEFSMRELKFSGTSEKRWKKLCGQETSGRFVKEHLKDGWTRWGGHFRWGTAQAKAQRTICHCASAAKAGFCSLRWLWLTLTADSLRNPPLQGSTLPRILGGPSHLPTQPCKQTTEQSQTTRRQGEEKSALASESDKGRKVRLGTSTLYFLKSPRRKPCPSRFSTTPSVLKNVAAGARGRDTCGDAGRAAQRFVSSFIHLVFHWCH